MQIPHISIAPMMDCTDKHFRYFMRLITPHVFLYSEMVTTGAILYGDRQRFLSFSPEEEPIALQLGGSDPQELAQCTKIANDYGYAEVNLNVGCPSDRVQRGKIGACLMVEPELVADCIAAMQTQSQVPVTVKTRIGIDHQDSYQALTNFIKTVAVSGCETFIIHARKAWLNGLSPKENRTIPPLKYEVVYQLKQDFPELNIIINGGIKTLQAIQQHLNYVDGVMIGREAYDNPYFLAAIEKEFFHNRNVLTRLQVLQNFIPYIQQQLHAGVPLKHVSRHILGLFQGVPGAKAWRRHISTHAHLQDADENVLLEQVPEFVETI